MTEKFSIKRERSLCSKWKKPRDTAGCCSENQISSCTDKDGQDPHTYKYSQQPLDIAGSHIPGYSSNTAPALWVPVPVLVWLCDAHCWAVLLQMELCRESSRTDTEGNTGRSFRVSALERTESQCIKNAARFPFKCSLKALEIVRRWLSDRADFFEENISSLFNVRMTQLWDWA